MPEYSRLPAKDRPAPEASGRRLAILSLAALGVVYGDIGTSPLYAMRECFHGEYAIAPTPENVLGVLSLMSWSLILVVSVKYLTYILRADNQGEGGVLALTALLRPTEQASMHPQGLLTMLGLFAASLLYGDGIITPAISVLSAVEGLRTVTPMFEPYILPLTIAILVGLFFLQACGTGRLGALFGPITLVWLLTIAILGVSSMSHRPEVLVALAPWYGVQFLWHNRLPGFLVLGAVFLVVTGTEALYADMGHFGKRPIRLVWFTLVLPALMCNYFGQGALLLQHPEEAHHPFYAMAPGWFIIPLLVLATAATIIASQAVITGAFSLTRQAIQLGYLPRLQVIHTSAEEHGQIYVPQLNLLLMLATILLVLGFGSSSRLAAAYGVAVTTTMLITSLLFYSVATRNWQWGHGKAAGIVGLFLGIDLGFFGANISKIAHGAWFPLVLGAGTFLLMTTWHRGRALITAQLYGSQIPLDAFLASLCVTPPLRVPGKAVYLAGSTVATPPALLHNLQHNHIIHEHVTILTLITEDVPYVARNAKVQIETLGQGFHRLVAHFGYTEEPNVLYVLALAREQGLSLAADEVSFFLGREGLVPARHSSMPRWRQWLFRCMARNAMGATTYFHIPPGRVVELGAQLEI